MSERIPAYQILVNGNDLTEAEYSKIEQVIYEEPEDGEEYFEIHFSDQDCSIQDGGKFVQDKTVCALFMGYIGDMDFFMDGVVRGLSPNYTQSDAPTYTVTVKNNASSMSRKEKNCAWKGKTYSQIAIAIAKKYNMEYDVDDTSKIFKASGTTCIYQTGMSDYMFLATCARKIGYTFRVQYNKLYFKHTITVRDEVYLDYRMGSCNLLTFKPNADSTNKPKSYYSDNVELSTADRDFDYTQSEKTKNGTKSVSSTKKTSTSKKTYKVRPGDYLIKIAKEQYNDGSRYLDIYNANTSKIKMPGYVIYAGDILVIP